MRNTQIRQNKEIIIKPALDVIICNMALGGSEKDYSLFPGHLDAYIEKRSNWRQGTLHVPGHIFQDMTPGSHHDAVCF